MLCVFFDEGQKGPREHFQGCNCEERALLSRGCTSEYEAWAAHCMYFGRTGRPQEATCPVTCPVHRTGRLFVEVPFETPGHDRSQDVSY